MRLITATIATLLLGGGIAFAAASDADLERVLAQQRADEAAWVQTREELDATVRANTRPLFRALLVPVVNAPDLATAQARAAVALDVLARPGPADSVAKTLHTVTRQAGAQALLALRRHIAETEALLP